MKNVVVMTQRLKSSTFPRHHEPCIQTPNPDLTTRLPPKGSKIAGSGSFRRTVKALHPAAALHECDHNRRTSPPEAGWKARATFHRKDHGAGEACYERLCVWYSPPSPPSRFERRKKVGGPTRSRKPARSREPARSRGPKGYIRRLKVWGKKNWNFLDIKFPRVASDHPHFGRADGS